jgi:hypothetical protein
MKMLFLLTFKVIQGHFKLFDLIVLFLKKLLIMHIATSLVPHLIKFCFFLFKDFDEFSVLFFRDSSIAGSHLKVLEITLEDHILVLELFGIALHLHGVSFEFFDSVGDSDIGRLFDGLIGLISDIVKLIL